MAFAKGRGRGIGKTGNKASHRIQFAPGKNGEEISTERRMGQTEQK